MNYTISRKLHTDFSIFEQNKLPARSYFIPFSDKNKLCESNYKNERYVSDRVQMLSGDWDFKYYDKLSKVPESFDAENTVFDKVTVPSTWQRTGYDQIAYINTHYAFKKDPPNIPKDVAVGIYRRKFDITSKSTQRILTFLGVAGGLAVYLNGKYIGYSEGSHNTAEFDVTEYLNEGENEIVAVNYKWCNGTYLECQDMFRENGIFRDVYIVSRNNSYVNDFLFRPSKNSDGTYDLKIKIDGCFENVSVKADGLFDTVISDTKETVIPSLKVNEWTAETPNVYEIIISVDGGEEIIRTYIGFKHIKIDGEVFLFNGKPIKTLGANHHDTHMTKGYAMSLDDLELDVKLMKEYNCNAVRTSHYPPDPAFLTMCDFYGLYVIDEADIETHGFYATPGTYRPNRLSNNLKWASHYLDRVSRMYERDKNHPSITMWSLGNEAGGYKCQDVCCEYLKKVNPEIPVHYEGVIRTKRWAYDVVSRMYAPPELMRDILNGKANKKYKGKPFFQCEYAHAMGNGPGRLEEYVQLFLSSKQFMGGCIWEWADHSVYDENAKYKWTYGGDHGETLHDGNFCVDGLFFPDRTPSSGALEMKVCYRPVRAKYIGKNTFELWNTRYFTDTSDIDIEYTVLVDGKADCSGKISDIIKPQERMSVTVDSQAFSKSTKDVFVNFRYVDKKNENEIATEQLVVSEAEIRNSVSEKAAEIKDSGKSIEVSFKNGGMIFDKKHGLISWKKNGKEILNTSPFDGEKGFVPHIYRGRLDNDMFIVMFWKTIGLDTAKAKLVSCKATNNGVKMKYNFISKGVLILASAYVDYKIDCNGKVLITSTLKKICPLTDKLPRFGLHAEMIPQLENVEYYGRGPAENYSDFKEHSPIGLYSETVSEMAHKYIKPQDSGNRGEVRESSIADENGLKVQFYASEKPFSFNANHFTLEQLKKANHIEDIPDVATTFVSVDGFVRGTGSNSCGPAPAPEHTIKFGYKNPLKFSFIAEIK